MKVQISVDLLLHFFIEVLLAARNTVENSIIGQPLVECGNEFIRFSAKTMKPFHGKVFVKGEYSNKDCTRSYGGSTSSSAFTTPTLAPGFGDESIQRKLETTTTTSRFGEDTMDLDRTESSLSIKTESTTATAKGQLEIRNGSQVGNTSTAAIANSFPAPEIKNQTVIDGGLSTSQILKILDRKGTPFPTLEVQGQDSDGRIADGSRFKATVPEKTSMREKGTTLSITESNIRSESTIIRSSTPPDESNKRGPLEQGLRISTKEPHPLKYPDAKEKHEFGSSLFTAPPITTRNPQCPPCPVCQDVLNIRRQREVRGQQEDTETKTTADLDVRLGTCNVKQEHRVEPRSMIVSFTVIVSFHPNLLTKLDRAYRIQCAYMEGSKMIGADLSVSMPPTTELDSKIDPPKCQYTVKGATGQTIMNARVGELVEHQWSCPSAFKGVHAMLIRNCYAESSNAHKVPVIDQNGCTMDSYILPNLQYGSDLLSAKTQAPVFKFPDRSDIGFQCDVAICLRGDRDCDSITPPKCGNGLRKRRQLHNVSAQNLILRSPTMNIVDLDDITHEQEAQQLIQESSTSNDPLQYCLTVAGFACTIASVTFLITTSVAVVGVACITSAFRYIERLPFSDASIGYHYPISE